jgi:hypothetical protein
VPSIPQSHPSTRQPLPPRPDPEALLLEAIRNRDDQQTQRLVVWWVHRRGLGALHTLIGRSLPPSDTAETLAWIQALIGAPQSPPSGQVEKTPPAPVPVPAPLNPEAEPLAQAPSSPAVLPAAPAELAPCPDQLANQAVAAVDAAIAQLMAEFPAEALAGLQPRQALEVLDGLEGSPALARLALVEPPAELLRDPDFQPQLTSFPSPAGADATQPAVATAFTALVAATPSASGADGTEFRSEPMGGPETFNSPLSFTIPQPEPTPLGLIGTAAAVEDNAGDGGLMLEQAAAESFRSLGGSLIAPLRGRLGVRRLARRVIDLVRREVGLVGSEGGLAHAAWEPPAEETTAAGHRSPMASGLEAPATLPPSRDATNAVDGHDAGFEGTGFDQAALDGTAFAGTAFEPWTTAIPAQAVADLPYTEAPAAGATTIVNLGERLRERMRQSADLPPSPLGDGAPAPRPAALADLGAWLPSAERPRAS